MQRLQIEYILKGIYLGLLLYIAMNQPDWGGVGLAALCTFGGLAVALCITAAIKLTQGFRIQGRLLPFVLFLLLESPTLAYIGILGGAFLGAKLTEKNPPSATSTANGSGSKSEASASEGSADKGSAEEGSGSSGSADASGSSDASDDEAKKQANWLLGKSVLGGAILGFIFGLLRDVQDRRHRLILSLLLAIGLVGGAVYLFGFHGKVLFIKEIVDIKGKLSVKDENLALVAIQILLGIPVFYLLTFAGREEESEIEVAAICATLALGLMMLFQAEQVDVNLRSIPFILPIVLYFFYTWKVLPHLKPFKHALRGLSYARVGRFVPALTSVGRALQLDPQHKLALETKAWVHRNLDLKELGKNRKLLELVDFSYCIQRAGGLLLNPEPPTAQLNEAHQFLTLVVNQRPQMKPKVAYWRTVAYTHARDYDRAAAELEAILSGQDYTQDDPQRWEVLVQAWQLALMLHEELRRRVGRPQLAIPGRRMEAIAAVEKHLADHPEDPEVFALKRLLYAEVTEQDYQGAAGNRATVKFFDHGYAQQLGLALINDAQRWQRGGEYLRMAARGLPALGPSIFIQIAKAHDRAGNADGAWHNYELAKRAGTAVDPRNLNEEDRHLYFAVVKMLGEEAQRQGNIDQAIEDFRLFSSYERSGIETMRTLASLHETREDPLSALHYTELGLVYNSQDRDLLERKDRYYFSVSPADLQRRLDTYGGGFDFEYCMKKSKAVLDHPHSELDSIDWALHLVRLGLAAKSDSIRAKVMLGRALLRRAEREEAVRVLDEVRTQKPEKFPSSDDEEAWYVCCQILGRLYLDELGKPDLAVLCFNEFKKSPRSGADTLFRLGQAHEQLGDLPKAMRFYEQVTAYESHPLASQAKSALYRLRGGG